MLIFLHSRVSSEGEMCSAKTKAAGKCSGFVCICVEVGEVILTLESREEVSKLLGFIFGGVNGLGKPRVQAFLRQTVPFGSHYVLSPIPLHSGYTPFSDHNRILFKDVI